MHINGETADATLCRRARGEEAAPGFLPSLAIGTVRWLGEMLLAYPASERRWLYVTTPAGVLNPDDVERLRSRGWR